MVFIDSMWRITSRQITIGSDWNRTRTARDGSASAGTSTNSSNTSSMSSSTWVPYRTSQKMFCSRHPPLFHQNLRCCPLCSLKVISLVSSPPLWWKPRFEWPVDEARCDLLILQVLIGLHSKATSSEDGCNHSLLLKSLYYSFISLVTWILTSYKPGSNDKKTYLQRDQTSRYYRPQRFSLDCACFVGADSGNVSNNRTRDCASWTRRQNRQDVQVCVQNKHLLARC